MPVNGLEEEVLLILLPLLLPLALPPPTCASSLLVAASTVVEFVGVRCHVNCGAHDYWPRVVRFKASIAALQVSLGQEAGWVGVWGGGVRLAVGQRTGGCKSTR